MISSACILQTPSTGVSANHVHTSRTCSALFLPVRWPCASQRNASYISIAYALSRFTTYSQLHSISHTRYRRSDFLHPPCIQTTGSLYAAPPTPASSHTLSPAFPPPPPSRSNLSTQHAPRAPTAPLTKLYKNLDRVVCTTCSTLFRNQAHLDEHHRAFYWPCKICYTYMRWCHVGAKGYAQIPYCRYACVQHGVCFETGEEAQDHGMRERHDRCFYPRCTNEMARGRVDEYYVYWHVREEHCQGK
jgi:hypothetical protein